MGITIVVDANPIISALIGGISEDILFDKKFEFVTSEFTIVEVKKYIPFISRKSGVKEGSILFAFSLLPLKIYTEIYYKDKIKEARELIEHRDERDVPILALTLTLNVPLWSMDKDFEDISGIKLLKTKDFL